MAVKGYRKRYIVFEIISNKEIEFETAKNAIIESSEKLIGSLGISKANLRFLSDFYKKNRGVIVVNHNYVSKIKLAIALIKKIKNSDAIVQTKKVYGTLKKIKSIF